MDYKLNNTEALAIQIAKHFDSQSITGLAGSLTNGNSDAFSDIDIAVIHETKMPESSKRQKIYEAFNAEVKWMDVDFEVSHGDGIMLDGNRIDFIHMEEPFVNKFIGDLDVNIECDEFLPGGLLSMCPIIDKYNSFTDIKARLQHYPENRARKRIYKYILDEHFNIYTLRWFEKAIVRNDEYSFLKNMFESMDRFMTVIHALNRTWFSNEKRLISILDKFPYTPIDASARIYKIIQRDGEFKSMRNCANEIIKLFSELSNLAMEVFSGLEVPNEWKMIANG